MLLPKLEPMSPPEIVDQAFRLYKKNFVRFLAIVAVIQIPVGLVTVIIQNRLAGGFHDPAEAASVTLLFLLLILVTVLGQTLCSAALVRSVSEFYLGREVTVGQAYRFIMPKLLAVVSASFLLGLLFFFGILFCVLPGILFMLWFSVTMPAIVVEDLGPVRALHRSKALVTGNLSSALLVGVLSFFVSIAVQMSAWAITLSLSFVMPADEKPYLLLQQLIPLAGGILIQPVTAGALLLLYYDLRIRKEGFDLELLALRRGEEGALTDAG